MKFNDYLKEMSNVIDAISKPSNRSMRREYLKAKNIMDNNKPKKQFNMKNDYVLYKYDLSHTICYILTDEEENPLLTIEADNESHYSMVKWVFKIDESCERNDVIDCYFKIAENSVSKTLMCDKLQTLGGKSIWKRFTRLAIMKGYKVGAYNHHKHQEEYVYNTNDYKNFDEWYKDVEKNTYTFFEDLISDDVEYTLFITV